MKHTEKYNATVAYAKQYGKNVSDIVQFNLYTTAMGAIQKTVTFGEMCEMIENGNTVFLSHTRHIPKIKRNGRIVGYDNHIVEQYEKAGFKVYCLRASDFNFFSEFYFEYM